METTFDPKTGKNLTISKAASSAKPGVNASDVSTATSEQPKGFFSKLLDMIGLGDAPAGDDDDFWARPQPSVPKEPEGGGTAMGGESVGDAGGDGGDGNQDDGLEDDSTSVDELDDLLG